MNDSVSALQAALAEHLAWHGARLNFLAQFLLALFKVRSVNLAELATDFGGKAQVGVSSRNGKYRTLRLGRLSERPESALFDRLALPPEVVAGQADVLPPQRRQVRQQCLVSGDA